MSDSNLLIQKVNEIAIKIGFKTYRHSEDCKVSKRE